MRQSSSSAAVMRRQPSCSPFASASAIVVEPQKSTSCANGSVDGAAAAAPMANSALKATPIMTLGTPDGRLRDAYRRRGMAGGGVTAELSTAPAAAAHRPAAAAADSNPAAAARNKAAAVRSKAAAPVGNNPVAAAGKPVAAPGGNKFAVVRRSAPDRAAAAPVDNHNRAARPAPAALRTAGLARAAAPSLRRRAPKPGRKPRPWSGSCLDPALARTVSPHWPAPA